MTSQKLFYVIGLLLGIALIYSELSHAQMLAPTQSQPADAAKTIPSRNPRLPQTILSGQQVKPNTRTVNTSTQRKTTQSTTTATPAQNPKKEAYSWQLRMIGGKLVAEEKPMIMLYMKNFKIFRDMSGVLTCTMDLFVRSTFAEKITNISYQLKWPQQSANASFDDVEANQPTFMPYMLFGKGCYEMDKTPNIIVNRCRIKGISQKECADAITWRK